MPRRLILFFLFFLIFSLTISAQEWKELNGEHFIIYFQQDEKFAKEVLHKAENYYQSIASDLGYPRYSEFWLWEKRVKIYIYPNKETYLKATAQPDWSDGMADYQNKRIISYAWNRGFVESLLPHEMAHLIFRDFIGFKGKIPLWLDEGVAQWSEQVKRAHLKRMAQEAFRNNTLLSITDMMNLDIRKIKDEKERVYIRSSRTKDSQMGVLFLSASNLIDIYYLESVAIVGFLIEKYGTSRFTEFCRQLRDGRSVEDALRLVYTGYINNLEDLENKLREYLEKSE